MIRFAHTNIVTDDWRRLAQFYVDVFGCSPRLPDRDLSGQWLDDATGIAGAHLMGVHLALPNEGPDGPTLEIFEYGTNTGETHHPPNARGFGHIAFRVDDVSEVMAKLVSCGGEPVGKLVTTVIPGAGTISFVYARDIDGNIIELQSWLP